jgi:predicted neuraminidase
MNRRAAPWLLVGSMVCACAAAFAEAASEFIFTEAPFKSAHASTIVETADGTLISAWFGGTDEGNPDVGIWSASKPVGGVWSHPGQLFKEPNQPAWNPVLFRDSSGVVWLWFKLGPSPERWSGAYLQSKDGGRTWSEPVWLPAGMLGPVRNKPIILSNGNILAGTSVESYRAWASWMELSEDGGRTWRRHGPIVFPSIEDNRKGTIQPTLLEIEPGVVRGLFRTRGVGKIATAISNDGGRSWGALTLTDLDHPSAGIDAVRLRDGRCLLVYNPSTRRRTPLSVAISYDGGATWKRLVDLEALAEGERGELSYPAVIQSATGDAHVVYTWNRRRIRHVVLPFGDIPGKLEGVLNDAVSPAEPSPVRPRR